MVFPTIQQRLPNERNHNCRLSDHLTQYVAHITLGVSNVAYSITAGWLVYLQDILPLNFPIGFKQLNNLFALSLFVIAVRFSVSKLSKSSYIPHFSRSGCDTQALCVYSFKPTMYTIRWNAYALIVRVLVMDTLLTLTEF